MQPTRLSAACLLLALLLTLLPPAAAQDAPLVLRMTFDGHARTVTLTVPPGYDGREPVPLILALHPFASSGKALQALTALDAVAAAQNAIVAYPDSLDLNWNEGREHTGWAPALQTTDDAGFLAALLDEIGEAYAVDPGRVFVVGAGGSGGSMAFRLACEMPQRLAGVAVVGALLWDYLIDACPPDAAAPVTVLVLNGAQNPDYPPRGRTIDNAAGDQPQTILGTEATAAYWARRNACDLARVQLDPTGPHAVHTGCADGTSVAVYSLDGVGGNWPRTGDYTLNQAGIDAARLIGQFVSGAPLDFTRAAHGPLYSGFPRQYTLYVPPTAEPDEPLPLVIALHGRPGTGAGLAYLFDLNRVAAAEGFAVVYPDGKPVGAAVPGNEWNYARGFPGFVDNGQDDVALLRTLAEDLGRDLNIDPRRIYVTGFSNGGFMTQRAACEAADTFAAFASVGATAGVSLLELCEGQPPAPMLLIHGTHDISVRWHGGEVQNVTIMLSAPDTVLFWSLHNGCQPDETFTQELPAADEQPATHAILYTFGGCRNNADVHFYAITGGGHNLPGVPDRLDPAIAGQVNTDIHAAEVIWDFFEAHPLADNK
jgi:polyhydroxybutyrate depolymerase